MPDEQENSDTTADRAPDGGVQALPVVSADDAPAADAEQAVPEHVHELMVTAAQDIGSFIRAQREAAEVSLRQLAKSAGVSNPYLSQIERGLRKPSAEVLAQIAKGLRLSSEALYVRAGLLEQRPHGPIRDAVLADTALTERQKQVLLEIYDSFRRENEQKNEAGDGQDPEPTNETHEEEER